MTLPSLYPYELHIGVNSLCRIGPLSVSNFVVFKVIFLDSIFEKRDLIKLISHGSYVPPHVLSVDNDLPSSLRTKPQI